MTTAVRTPPSRVRRIRSEAEAAQLAGWLVNARRGWPVVVVTIPSGQTEPFGDPDAVAEAVSGLAEVVVLPTSGLSWAFSHAMPPSTQVYGGAGRVYPVSGDWITDPGRARLRFAYSRDDRERVTGQLVGDALTAAAAAGLGPLATSQQAQQRSGTVEGIVGSRALVRLDDAMMASVWEELTVAGVPLHRVLTKGQHVTGLYDLASRRLDLRAGLRFASPVVARAAVVDAYRVGDVVWADVVAVTADTVTLRLLPGVTVEVHRDAVTANPQDSMGELFTTGETVAARITALDAAELRLRVDTVDGEAPVPAPSLLPDGPPWLPPPANEMPVARAQTRAAAPLPPVAGVPRQATPLDLARGHSPVPPPAGPAGTPAAAVPGPAALTRAATDRAALHAERAARENAERDLEALRVHAASLQDELARAHQRIENLQTRYRTADLARQHAVKQLRGHQSRSDQVGDHPGSDGPAFLQDEDQFRHEVYTEWARRIPAAEKADKPLADYRLAPGFLTSLNTLHGVSRAKVVSVVVEVLTGQAPHLAGRDLHQLRTGSNGSPYLTRPDGATCWRVALQRGTASARRMHYWRTADSYELSRVTVHDDFQP